MELNSTGSNGMVKITVFICGGSRFLYYYYDGGGGAAPVDG